jgi:hypothetical protein
MEIFVGIAIGEFWDIAGDNEHIDVDIYRDILMEH